MACRATCTLTLITPLSSDILIHSGAASRLFADIHVLSRVADIRFRIINGLRNASITGTLSELGWRRTLLRECVESAFGVRVIKFPSLRVFHFYCDTTLFIDGHTSLCPARLQQYSVPRAIATRVACYKLQVENQHDLADESGELELSQKLKFARVKNCEIR